MYSIKTVCDGHDVNILSCSVDDDVSCAGDVRDNGVTLSLTFSGRRRTVSELSDPAVVTARKPPLLAGRVTSNHRLLLLQLMLRMKTMPCVACVVHGLVLLSADRRP